MDLVPLFFRSDWPGQATGIGIQILAAENMNNSYSFLIYLLNPVRSYLFLKTASNPSVSKTRYVCMNERIKNYNKNAGKFSNIPSDVSALPLSDLSQ